MKICSLGMPDALIASPTSFSEHIKIINFQQFHAGRVYMSGQTILVDQRAVQMPIAALQRMQDGLAHLTGFCLPCACRRLSI